MGKRGEKEGNARPHRQGSLAGRVVEGKASGPLPREGAQAGRPPEGKVAGIAAQAGVLAAATIIVRIIGLLYRAPLTAIIGDEGNGYYGAAYNIYMIILILSSNSLPAAISRQMSTKIAVGGYREAQRAFHCALAYSLLVGAAGSLLLYLGAGLFVPSHAVPVLRVFAPTVFLFGILGAIRGYFQANQSMVQTSVSQILEQIMNAAVSIGAATVLVRTALPNPGGAAAAAHAAPGGAAAAEFLAPGGAFGAAAGGPAAAAATERAVRGAMGSALGTGSGVAAALLFMAAAYLRHRGRFMDRIQYDGGKTASYPAIMRETILCITPFIASSFILNLTTTLDQMVYLRMLIGGRGLSEAAVTTVYGLFSNKAVVITNIPISVATAVSAAIIPNIATAHASGDLAETRRRAANASRMALVISIPCAVGLVALARPVTMLMFPQWDTLDLASCLLALQAVTVVFLSVGTITNAVLQAIGRMHMPIVSAGLSLAIQTAALVLFLRFTDWGIYAMVFVSVLYAAIIFALNAFFLRRYLGLQADAWRAYGAPLVSAAVMGVAAFGVHRGIFALASRVRGDYFANFAATVPAILVAIFVYFFLLARLGGFSREDALALPKGEKIARLFIPRPPAGR